MINPIVEQHYVFLNEFLKKDVEKEAHLSTFEKKVLKKAQLLLKGQEELLLNRYKKSDQSLLQIIREFLMEENRPILIEPLEYLHTVIFFNELFYEKFARNKYSYLDAVNDYLETDMDQDLDASEEWRAYFRFRFRKTIFDFARFIIPGHQFTMNFGLWTFKGAKTLPVYSINAEEIDKKERDNRSNAFLALQPFQKYHSFIWEAVSNDIQTIFYFDQVEGKHMYIDIYEIDADISGGTGRGRSRFFGKCTIQIGNQVGNESHPEHIKAYRNTTIVDSTDPEGSFSKIEEARNTIQQEKDYQYSVIRNLIRIGFFNPQNAAYKEGGNKGKVSYHKKILEGKSGLIEICENQYKKSKERLGFDHKEKFTLKEDLALNRVIDYICEYNSDFINHRIATFEIGLFWLIENATDHDPVKGNDINFIYWLPLLTNWRGKKIGGTIFLNSDKRIKGLEYEKGDLEYKPDMTPEERAKEITPDLEVPQTIITILHYLSGVVIENQIEEIEDTVRGEALNSAAISIMSRNISHNIGSHVLSYLKKNLSDERLMIKKGVIDNLFKLGQDSKVRVLNRELISVKLRLNARVLDDHLLQALNANNLLIEEDGKLYLKIDTNKISPKFDFDVEGFKAPYLRSLGRLMEYFQERQDYIGAIAAKWHLYFSPINFQEQILDYFYKNYSNSVDNNSGRNLILDYITYSEDFDRSHIEFVYELPYKNSTMVAIPTGITGRHGFFTIIENLIRNTAKHGKRKSERDEGKLRLDIRVKEISNNNNYFEVSILDNGGQIELEKLEKINSALKRPLTKRESGVVDEEHKGIKEMQIAAGWLRGIQPAHLFSRKKPGREELPILQVSDSPVGLKYTFYMLRPKEVLFLVEDLSVYFNNRAIKEEYRHLITWDWQIESLSSFENQNFLKDQRLPFRFILIHPNLARSKKLTKGKTLRNIQNSTSVRLLSIPFIGEDTFKDNSWDYKAHLYSKWLDGFSINASNSAPNRYKLIPTQNLAPSEIPIGISDDKKERIVLKNGGVIDEASNPEEQLILFRSHNDHPKKFRDYQIKVNDSGEKYYDHQIYLEGITGNNSTNRLLRTEEKNAFWMMKIREMALTRILIIDERIWAAYCEEEYRDHTTFDRLAKKNIDLLTLDDVKEDLDHLHFRNLKKESIGTLHKTGLVTITHEDYKKYHFISLHQGLLDRMMNFCDKELSEHCKTDKHKARRLFHEYFRKNCFDTYHEPFRYIIHSGRSKTPFLPPNTTFLQLSTLDAALSDCKYTLTELLYSSIIETDTNE